jgi:iron complex transport system substrate-binding protein
LSGHWSTGPGEIFQQEKEKKVITSMCQGGHMSITRILVILSVLSLFVGPGLVTAQDIPFTIQADESLQTAIDALYAAAFDGAAPSYVEAEADLLVTSDSNALADATGNLPDYFLPGAGIVALTGNANAVGFIDFVVSPDGQQVLIDAGFLPASVTITDQAGNTVEIPQPVRSVITPYSMATYMVYGVDGEDRLAAAGYLNARDEPGISRMTQIDPRFPELSSYTMSQKEINVEEVALLAPDVILTSTRSQWLDAVAELNIPVVLFQGESPEALKEAVRITGQMLGPNTAARAEAWVAYYDSILKKVETATAGLDKHPTVLFVGTEPLRIASGDMYQTSIVEAAGGTSVSRDLTGYWNDVNLEQIVMWNPDVIITTPYGVSPDALTGSAEWRAVSAAQNGQVYAMPSYVAPWDTPIPESVLGVIWMAGILYPDQVDLDCATETAYFYHTFYNYELPKSEITALCGS